MQITTNLQLKKPDAEDFYNVEDLNDNMDVIDTAVENKVDKIDGMGLSESNYTEEEKEKLSGIETNANNYIHPTEHEADIIAEDTTHRFVTDAEKSTWNNTLQNAKDYADDTYQQATGYTDTKIAELINGAPTTLDTLKEIADAIEANESIVDALDSAIGTKASEIEFSNHNTNTTIHITADERENWNNMLPLTGGTVNGTVMFSKSTLAPVTIERTTTEAAAVKFMNENGTLGYIGMSGSADGGLNRYSANAQTKYVILDTANYKSYCPPKSHSSTEIEYGVGTENSYGHCRVMNNLTTDSFTSGQALSAYQGYLLNDKIENLTTNLSQLNGLTIQLIDGLSCTQSGSNTGYADITLSSEFKDDNYMIFVDTNNYDINSSLSSNVKYAISNKTTTGFRITLHIENGHTFGTEPIKIICIEM